MRKGHGVGLVFVMLSGLCVPAWGAPYRLSVEQAMRLAARTAERLTIAQADLRRARAQQLQVLSQWLPQIGGSAVYERTLASEFSSLSALMIPGEPNLFAELPFGRPHTWRFGIAGSQLLFAGGRVLAQRRLAGAGYQAAEIRVGSERAQAVLNGAQAYYDVVLARLLVGIAQATLQQAERTAEETRLGYQAGTLAEFDLLRAQVAVDNQQPLVLQRHMDLRIAELQLKQVLDLPPETKLELTASLEGELPSVAATAASVAQIPAEAYRRTRSPVREAQLAVQMREQAIRVAWSQWLPALVLSGDVGVVGHPKEFFPSRSDFRLTSIIGVSLQVPIFEGGLIYSQLQAARADAVAAQAELKLVGKLSQLAVSSTEEELRTARANWLATGSAVGQAERAYAIADVRYRAGVSTLLELNDARLALQVARGNRARAARNLQVARVREALLPALPLEQAPVPPVPAIVVTVGGAAAQAPETATSRTTRNVTTATTPRASQGGISEVQTAF